MSKTYTSNHPGILADPFYPFPYTNSAYLMAVVAFVLVCLGASDSIKFTMMFLAPVTILCGLLRFSVLRARVTWTLFAVTLVVLMDGISIFYAVSRKFALSEFLQVLLAFCLTILLVTLAKGKDTAPSRWIATVLEGNAALAGIISIDLISTRIISGAVVSFLSLFTDSYSVLNGIEPGVRITSIYTNPNIFAGVVGLGVLLSLGLALSAQTRKEKIFHLSCLFANSLAFVLAFSMGATAMIALGFVVYLILEQKERRPALFILMLETLVLVVCVAALVSMTSFQTWDGVQPVPLIALIVGAAALCAIDLLVGQKVALKAQKLIRLLPVIIGGTLALVIAFLVTACFITSGITLEAGGTLRRAAYPEAGDYTLEVQADAPVTVIVESQNQQDTVMHTSTILYQGPLTAAMFTVPEDSLVVYFNFAAEQNAYLEEVSYVGSNDSGSVPLKYMLLPSFIANRLQGILANQNAIQRVVFFSDGMKLFRRSPIVGLGMGAFENGASSVQSFYYEAKHVHNQYIQTLIDTGIVGLILFIGLLGISAAAVLLSRKKGNWPPLAPALGAALVFMAGHAATEVVFTSYCYLPMAFGVFALVGICCGDALPVGMLVQRVKNGVLAVIAVLLVIFAVLLGRNIEAMTLIRRNPTFDALDEAVKLDVFEDSDYMLTYVTNSLRFPDDEVVQQQADVYAEQLSELNSNIIPYYLAEYYFQTDRLEQALAMLEKYVNYVSSDSQAWQDTFDLLEEYETDSEAYRAGVARIAQMMETWDAEHIGTITIDENTTAFIARVTG